MDIFNSALKNPVPPTVKKEDDKGEVKDSIVKKKKKNSRRRHRNSHLGCGTCKKRRIKCDETLPSCINCLKGKLYCAYLNLDDGARKALKIAQYNLSTRQEKIDEDRQGGHMVGSPEFCAPTTNFNNSSSPLPNEGVSMIGSPRSYSVPYPVAQSGSSVGLPRQACIVQSPYGLYVSLQPLTQPMIGVGVPYSQVPVIQPQVSIMYSNGQAYQTYAVAKDMTASPLGHLPTVAQHPALHQGIPQPTLPQPSIQQNTHGMLAAYPYQTFHGSALSATYPSEVAPSKPMPQAMTTSPASHNAATFPMNAGQMDQVNSDKVQDQLAKDNPKLPPLNNDHSTKYEKIPKISKLLS